MKIKVLQLHKRASIEYKFIQDKYAINGLNNVVALADGTTQSFKSETWADLITRKFVLKPTFKNNTLISLLREAATEHQKLSFELSPNPAKASLEKTKKNKGSTATFIGLEFINSNEFEIISSGDSNLFLLTDKKVKSFPFSDINSLDGNRYFINTEELLKGNVKEIFFTQNRFQWQPSEKIILATDALSRLILQKPEIIPELLRIEEFEDLLSFCLKYWEKKELQEDDISAIIISNEIEKNVKIISPHQDFSFPEEEKEVFVPATLPHKKPNKTSDMEMNEIRNQFQGVASDFHQIKKKLKLHEMLLMATVGLLVLNLVSMFLFQPKNNIKESDKVNSEVKNLSQNNEKLLKETKKASDESSSKEEATK